MLSVIYFISVLEVEAEMPAAKVIPLPEPDTSHLLNDAEPKVGLEHILPDLLFHQTESGTKPIFANARFYKISISKLG